MAEAKWEIGAQIAFLGGSRRKEAAGVSWATSSFASIVRGLPYMTSAKFSDFLTPSPIVTVTNQLMVFLSSAFLRTPPHPLRTSYMEAP